MPFSLSSRQAALVRSCSLVPEMEVERASNVRRAGAVAAPCPAPPQSSVSSMQCGSLAHHRRRRRRGCLPAGAGLVFLFAVFHSARLATGACENQLQWTFLRNYVNLLEIDFNLRLEEWDSFCKHVLPSNPALNSESSIKRAWIEYTRFLPITDCVLVKNETLRPADDEHGPHNLAEKQTAHRLHAEVVHWQTISATLLHEIRSFVNATQISSPLNATSTFQACSGAAACTLRLGLDVVHLSALILLAVAWRLRARCPTANYSPPLQHSSL